MFDEQPDDDPHGECRHEIERLQVRVAELERSERISKERELELREAHTRMLQHAKSAEAQLDALRKREPAVIVRRGVNAYSFLDSTGLRGYDDLPDGSGLYTQAPPTTAVPEGYTPVKTETLRWLLGEEGDFECPTDKYFMGKPAPYFWRSSLRDAMFEPSI